MFQTFLLFGILCCLALMNYCIKYQGPYHLIILLPFTVKYNLSGKKQVQSGGTVTMEFVSSSQVFLDKGLAKIYIEVRVKLICVFDIVPYGIKMKIK